MAIKRNFLKKNKKYSVTVLYSVDIKTIEQLNYSIFGIQCLRIFSEEFEKFASEITYFETLKEEFSLLKFYHGEVLTCLVYSETEKNINDFLNFLIILRPSYINKWLEFDIDYSDLYVEGKKSHHTIGYSIWNTIHELHDNTKTGTIFHLVKDDIQLVNKLAKRYLTLSKRTFFIDFLSLYNRAYFEKRDYFKFILLFMIVESMIKDDETTGVDYKIRRLCAVLIGRTSEDCEIIYNNTNAAYKKRSMFVHSAKIKLMMLRICHIFIPLFANWRY